MNNTECEETMNKENIEQKIIDAGFSDFKWINPEKIKISQWVRMKCMFGCANYGKKSACPPNILSVSDCEKFISEYSHIIIFHFEKKFDIPEDRFKWAENINKRLSQLEREIFLSGYVKVFLLLMDSCSFCKECAKKRNECNNPLLSRPTPEALAIDVFTTVKNVNYPIKVLTDYSEKINKYAFMLIE